MRNIKRVFTVGSIVAVMLVAVFGLNGAAGAVNAPLRDMALPASQAHVPGTFLTGANAGAPLDIALNYIRQNGADLGLTAADVTDMAVSDKYQSQHNGVTHIYFQQQLNGIRVYNAILNINIARDGSVINLGSRFVPDLANAIVADKASISAAEAVSAVAGELGLDLAATLQAVEVIGGASEKTIFEGAGISQDAIPVELKWQPTDDGVYLAWDMVINEFSNLHWWSIRADAASGRILSQYDWVVHESKAEAGGSVVTIAKADQPEQAAPGSLLSNPAAANNPDEYFVFAYPLESPLDGSPSLELNPADPTASPFGWHDTNGAPGNDYTITRGNNVYADSDLDNNNVPDGNAPDGGAGLIFNEPYNLSLDPSQYLTASIINLFYWNNIMHDITYRYGFDEVSGNFQENNYGHGGIGSDSVNADAQDGNGLDDANFLTPPDGFNPRMQMYRTTYPFGQAVTVTAPITLSGLYTANPSMRGGTANGLSANVELVVDGTAPTNDACQTVTNDLTGKIALIVWSGGLCSSNDFVLNAANAGAIAAVIVDATVVPLTYFGGNAAIPSVAVGSTDGQGFIAALNHHVVTATIGDHPVQGVDRDTDLDNGVIAHEYGHGVSNRLTGGPNNTNCLGNAEQMGEGWSDLQTLIIYAAPGDMGPDAREVGVWSLGFGFRGTRDYPYSTDMNINPLTYNDIIANPEAHHVGAVWASIVWEVYWNLVGKHGFNANIYNDWTTGGNNLTYQLMMDGMKLQPCRPGFVDGRDGILTADMVLTGGDNQCEIWAGFARRGLGFSASQGSSSSTADGTEAFDLPMFCTSADAVVSGIDSPDPVEVGSPLMYEFVVGNYGVVTATNVVFTNDLDTDTDFASVSTTQGSCSEAGGQVICSLNDINPGQAVTVTVVVTPRVVGMVTSSAVVSITEPENTSNNSIDLNTTVNVSEYTIYLPAVRKGGAGFLTLTTLANPWQSSKPRFFQGWIKSEQDK